MLVIKLFFITWYKYFPFNYQRKNFWQGMLLQVWLRSEHKFILMQRRILLYSHLFNNNHHYMISVFRLTATILIIFDFYLFFVSCSFIYKKRDTFLKQGQWNISYSGGQCSKKKLLMLVLNFFKFACVSTPFLLHQENASLLCALSSSKARRFSSSHLPRSLIPATRT